MKILYGEPLSRHTTFKIGGNVRAMYFPEDAEAAAKLCLRLRKQGDEPRILGRGSNVLASDGELDFTVINTLKMNRITRSGNIITADAGAMLTEISKLAAENSLTGMEFAHGIPGTIGGAVMMNAGAYGSEMQDVVQTTVAYSTTQGKYAVTGDEHKFSYRKSVFACNGDMILSSAIELSRGDKFAIEEKMKDLGMRRKESQPLDKASAGSTFKRPQGGYAAMLIEEAGLKGYTIGGAQISLKHAGFIINTGNATFSDILKLIEYVQETVKKRTGISLSPEVKIWK